MFDNLQNRLNLIFQKLKGYNKINEFNIAESLKEIKKSLIDSDVNLNVVNDFIKKIKKKSIGKDVISSINPSQLIIKLIYDELVKLMGQYFVDINLQKNISIILIVGLQGSGKTTFSAKIANYLKLKKNKNPLLVSVDIYRPAAINQLKILSEKNNISFFMLNKNKNPLEISEEAIKYASFNKNDVIIIDTAGRLSVDKLMMDEIKNIKNKVNPSEILFVIDSMMGQDAINSAKTFFNVLKFDGFVLSKLDGDTKGGVGLTICSIIPKPIKFISTGEKIESIDIFYPERMAKRILGMGDIVSLVERAQEQFDENKIKKIYKKINNDKFGFDDLLNQINKIKKMGNAKDLISMIPGMNIFSEKIDNQTDIYKNIESIIFSMTPYERKNPKIINTSRKIRLSKGSGIPLIEINKILKQFNKIKDIIKVIQTNEGKKLMQNIFFNKQ